jgi:hypothetical protein
MTQKYKKLLGLVFTSLDNAYEGGYAEVACEEPEVEARSLLGFDADVAAEAARVRVGEKEVAELVQAWQMQKDADLHQRERQEFDDRADEFDSKENR